MARLAVGGWEFSTIAMMQSGPFMTPTMSRGSDKTNTNVVERGVSVRPDALRDGNPDVGNAIWDIGAFAIPAAGVGRFGNAGVVAVAAGLAKNFQITERVTLRLESTFTNLPNHPNFREPARDITTSTTFGRLLAVQSTENSGNRIGQVALRIQF